MTLYPPAGSPGKYWNVTKRLLTSARKRFTQQHSTVSGSVRQYLAISGEYERDITLQGRVRNHRAKTSGARGCSPEQHVRAGRSVENLLEIRLRDGDCRSRPRIERIPDRRRGFGSAQPILSR